MYVMYVCRYFEILNLQTRNKSFAKKKIDKKSDDIDTFPYIIFRNTLYTYTP